MKTAIVYVLASLGEIAGCFSFWAWLRLGKSPLWLVPGMASLALFAYLLTRIDSSTAGRAYAAYRQCVHRVVHLLALGRGGRASRSLGHNRRSGCLGWSGHHRVWSSQLALRIMIQSGRQLPVLQGPEKTACGVAIATAAGAVLCGVCCVLPFALPAVALASSGTAIAWLASGYSWATTIAVAIVGAAWLWIAVRSVRAQARPSSATFYAMGIATVVLGLAVVWPRIEPSVIALLKAQGSAATVAARATTQAANARQATTPQVTVELIAAAPSVPTTSDLWVGLRFRLQDGWHIYLEKSW